MEKIDQLESAIREFDSKYVFEKSQNISVLEDITEKQISFHVRKLHLVLDTAEKPLRRFADQRRAAYLSSSPE